MILSENTARCDACGALIKRPPNQIKKAKYHFCNNVDCRAKWQSEFMTGSTYKQNPTFMINEGKKKCRKCSEVKTIKEFSKSKGGLEGFASWCKACVSENGSKYYADKRDGKLGDRRKNGVHKQKVNQRTLHPRGVSEILTKLRIRINDVVNRTAGAKKCKKTIDFIGCSPIELRDHLQETAINNGYLEFDIQDYDGMKYHIDHIKPCTSFNLLDEREQRECFHYSNLQILDAITNLKKSNK